MSERRERARVAITMLTASMAFNDQISTEGAKGDGQKLTAHMHNANGQLKCALEEQWAIYESEEL